MSRRFYIAGFAFGLIAVILGAFATHGLKPLLSPDEINTFETGVKYQIYHALLLLLIGNFQSLSTNTFKWVFYLLITGIVLFSGSIFLLATNSLTAFDFKVFGPVTPIGGTLLILCWIILLTYSIKLKKK